MNVDVSDHWTLHLARAEPHPRHSGTGPAVASAPPSLMNSSPSPTIPISSVFLTPHHMPLAAPNRPAPGPALGAPPARAQPRPSTRPAARTPEPFRDGFGLFLWIMRHLSWTLLVLLGRTCWLGLLTAAALLGDILLVVLPSPSCSSPSSPPSSLGGSSPTSHPAREEQRGGQRTMHSSGAAGVVSAGCRPTLAPGCRWGQEPSPSLAQGIVRCVGGERLSPSTWPDETRHGGTGLAVASATRPPS